MVNQKTQSIIKAKVTAALVHALFTLFVAATAAWVVYRVWYPNGVADLSGGTELYKLILLCELCLGPLISLVIYDPNKARKLLIRDYAIVTLIQVSALIYGLYAVASARPVFYVFVIDRVEVVSAIDLADEDLELGPSQKFSSRSLAGPVLACYNRPTDVETLNDIKLTAAGGKDVHLRPQFYRECNEGEMADVAKSLADRSFNDREKAILVDRDIDPDSEIIKGIAVVQTGRFWTLVFEEQSVNDFRILPIDSLGQLSSSP